MVPHDGTPALKPVPGNCPALAAVEDAEVQQDSLHQPRYIGRLRRSRSLAQDRTT